MKAIRLRNIFFFFLVVLLSGCSSSGSKQYHIGLSQCSDDAWRTKMNEEMRRELLFHPEMSLRIRSGDDNSVHQSCDIDSFIAERVDLLIVSPNEPDGLTDAVSRAYDAGIPVIVADRRVHGDKYTAFIGGDNLQVGHLLANYILENLPQGGRILEIQGLEGSTPAVLRHEGMMEMLEGNNISVVSCCGEWFRDKAENVVRQILEEDSHFDLIVAQNDLMGMGASDALEQVVPGKKIKIIGVDALPGMGGGLKAVAEGELDASVSYATAGDLIISTAADILEGKPFLRDTVIPAMLITPIQAEALMDFSDRLEHEVATVTMMQNRVKFLGEVSRQQQLLIILTICFSAVVLLFLFHFLRLYQQRKRLSEQLMKAQKDLEHSMVSKLTFFTNVSHDFRTPLTLVTDPVSQLANDHTLTKEQHELARMAQKNSQVLLRLINQTLDFRKYESGMLRLNNSRVDLLAAMSQWVDAFQPLAHRRHVRLTMTVEPDIKELPVVVDVEKVERIVYNLLSNAFKFTPANGSVELRLTETAEQVVFSVIDTGVGIPKEHKQHIFDSYYQGDSTQSQGSGIGLALVHSFVLLHRGTIDLTDNTPTGTIFTVRLPKGNLQEVEVETGEGSYIKITAEQILIEQDELSENADFGIIKTIGNQLTERVLFVIDDNSDIRHYLRQLFKTDYTVITAKNGVEGCKKAAQMVPDIIICDVSMPDMDGLEVTKQLKTETATSHIPILMLTAHAMDEQRVAGLEHGADAYMAKPFNSEVLRAQVQSLVANRQRIKSGNVQMMVTTTKSNGNPSLEEKFVAQFNTIVEENLNDETLSVETIADRMALSRTQLYRKIKQLTNYSPNELVRIIRLQHARNLLLQGQLSVSEVAYSTGFSSPSYFTKCYTDFFGERPSARK